MIKPYVAYGCTNRLKKNSGIHELSLTQPITKMVSGNETKKLQSFVYDANKSNATKLTANRTKTIQKKNQM